MRLCAFRRFKMRNHMKNRKGYLAQAWAAKANFQQNQHTQIKPPNTIIQQPEIRSQIDFLRYFFLPPPPKHVNWPLGRNWKGTYLRICPTIQELWKVLLPVHSKLLSRKPLRAGPLEDPQKSARTWDFDSHTLFETYCLVQWAQYATNQTGSSSWPSTQELQKPLQKSLSK